MSLPSIDSAGLFDVRGKSAVIVGATGAFGKVACATLGSAGARLDHRPPGKPPIYKSSPRNWPRRTSKPTRWLRGRTPRRAESIVQGAVTRMAAWIFLVIASGMNDVAPIVDNVAGALRRRHAGNLNVRGSRGGRRASK